MNIRDFIQASFNLYGANGTVKPLIYAEFYLRKIDWFIWKENTYQLNDPSVTRYSMYGELGLNTELKKNDFAFKTSLFYKLSISKSAGFSSWVETGVSFSWNFSQFQSLVLSAGYNVNIYSLTPDIDLQHSIWVSVSQ